MACQQNGLVVAHSIVSNDFVDQDVKGHDEARLYSLSVMPFYTSLYDDSTS
jgi:hypothetical protein